MPRVCWRPFRRCSPDTMRTSEGATAMNIGIVPPDVEQLLVAPPRPSIPSEHLESFVAAACDVLEQELHTGVTAGAGSLQGGSCTTRELTVIVGITGQLTGLAIFAM